MKQFLVGSVCAAFSMLGFTPIATADDWVPVTISEFDGKTYLIDMQSRRPYISQTGWRHVAFEISTSEDKNAHVAIAACEPYQLNVPDYGWQWEIDNHSYSVYTVGGKLARAACNW